MEENDIMNYGGGAWFWIVIILLFRGNLFGGENNQINSDFLYRDITGVNNNVLTSACATQKEVLESRYDNALGQANLGAQFAQCCCENKLLNAQNTSAIQAQMYANTQAILDKLCANEVQNLRDQLAEKDRELAQSNILSINQAQTSAIEQTILNAMGKWYPFPPVNPYYAYNTCSNNI